MSHDLKLANWLYNSSSVATVHSGTFADNIVKNPT